uniref:Potential DNA-binding domain-containing protein n=1 Tax=Trichuris muris TaxID=70415 RepID=A0A5S6QR58_TRIMR
MPTLSVNTPEEDETAQVIVEPRKPINANGMFGRYERNSIDNCGAQSSSIPLKPEPSTSPLNSPAISSSNVKTWTQPLATPAKSFPNIELAVPSGDAKVKLSQHARPTIAPATFGQQIASSKPSHISTSSLSVSELLNVDAVNQAPADDGPKTADIANSRQESLVCHYEHFLCTRPVISGELYCMVHLRKRPKNTLHCNYINSESDDDCDQPLLNEMHSSCGLCPRHSTLAEARRSTYNKKLESRRTFPRILGLEPSKDTCQWRSSPDEQ